MRDTITIAPVRKSIRVKASQAHAFDVFTADIGMWWPRPMKINKAALKTVVLEGRLGGRWYEVSEDGSEATLGKVLDWDPPRGFVMSWQINYYWQVDASVSAEVAVSFIADGTDATIVELEHRKFEAFGPEGGASIRERVDRGWPRALEAFKTAVDA